MTEETTAYDFQDEFETKAKGIGKGRYGRILKMAHTPSKEEYTKTLYITSIGIILIGAMGFAIWWLMAVMPTYF